MEYKSNVKLGEKYVDPGLGVEGIASGLSFYQHGCERVRLEWTSDGEVHTYAFDAPHLRASEQIEIGQVPHVYYSDVELGEKYKDTQTGIEGTANVITFYENASESVQLEYTYKGELRTETFDAPRLESKRTKTRVPSAKPGGPDRQVSRAGSVGR